MPLHKNGSQILNTVTAAASESTNGNFTRAALFLSEVTPSKADVTTTNVSLQSGLQEIIQCYHFNILIPHFILDYVKFFFILIEGLITVVVRFCTDCKVESPEQTTGCKT